MKQSWSNAGDLEKAVLAGLDASQGYWNALPCSALPLGRAPLLRSYDIVIVGAGLTGALLAEALSSTGRSLLVIDRRLPFSGGTAASSAIIQPGFEEGLAGLSEIMGPAQAEHLWHRLDHAVEQLLALISRLGIECGLERKRSMVLAGADQSGKSFEREANLRNQAGFRTQFVGREQLIAQFGIDRAGALISPVAATLNPVQLAAGLLAHASRRGAEIVGNVEILDSRQSGGRIHLLTSEGDFLSAGHVVFCTGCETPDCIPTEEGHAQSVIAIASRPGIVPVSWLTRHVVRVSASDNFNIRTTTDGRVIAHCLAPDTESDWYSPLRKFGRFHDLSAKVSRLIGLEIGEPEYCWAGSVSTARLGLPVIARLPDQPQAHAVLGYGTNGMTFCQIASEIVQAAIEGRQDPDEPLFGFTTGTPQPMPA